MYILLGCKYVQHPSIANIDLGDASAVPGMLGRPACGPGSRWTRYTIRMADAALPGRARPGDHAHLQANGFRRFLPAAGGISRARPAPLQLAGPDGRLSLVPSRVRAGIANAGPSEGRNERPAGVAGRKLAPFPERSFDGLLYRIR